MEEARTKGGVACCDILRFRRNGSAWHKAPWTLDGTGAKSLRAAAIRTLGNAKSQNFRGELARTNAFFFAN